MDKAAYLTALLAAGSLLSGYSAGVVINMFTGMGLATALITFVEAASKATEVAPGVSVVPNVPEQVEGAAKALEQAVTGEPEQPGRPRVPYLALGILLSNIRPLALIPAVHSVLPLSMLLEGRGRLKPLTRRHEDFIMAAGLAPLAINGFAMGGSLSEYPVLAPLLGVEALSLATASYVASKALLLEASGLGRLRKAYRGSLGLFTAAVLFMALAASYEAYIVSIGGEHGS